MELGDDSTYKIEGVGSTSLQLVLGTVLHIDDVLYVLGLKKNLLSVSSLEDKGFRVLFMDKKVLLWAKNEDLSSTIQIGVQEEGLYKAFKDSTHAIDPCELWHRRFGHLHYTTLPGLQKIVSRDMVFHEKVVFRQTQELSKEDEVPPLEFPISETRREEEEFEDQIPDVPEDTESPPEELLEVPPSKRKPAWYRETVQEGRGIKLLLGLSKKA